MIIDMFKEAYNDLKAKKVAIEVKMNMSGSQYDVQFLQKKLEEINEDMKMIEELFKIKGIKLD